MNSKTLVEHKTIPEFLHKMSEYHRGLKTLTYDLSKKLQEKKIPYEELDGYGLSMGIDNVLG